MESFSQEKQFEKCQVCLNRKTNYTGYNDICNLRGKDMNFTEFCPDFALDQSAKPAKKNDDFELEDLTDVPIKSTQNKAKISIFFIVAVATVNLILIGGFIWRHLLLSEFENSKDAMIFKTLKVSDDLIQSLSILHIVLFIISGIFFIIWLGGVYNNLDAKGIKLRRSKAMTIFGWFIPIINLFYPYQILTDFDSKITRLVNRKNPAHLEQPSNFIGTWWTLWIITEFLGRITDKLPTDTVEQFKTEAIVEIISSALIIILAVMIIKIMKSFIRKENILRRLETKKNILEAI